VSWTVDAIFAAMIHVPEASTNRNSSRAIQLAQFFATATLFQAPCLCTRIPFQLVAGLDFSHCT